MTPTCTCGSPAASLRPPVTSESRRELPLPRMDGSVPLPDDLDVAGGWGYSREDRCILLDFGDEGAGVPCEYEFIPRRIRQERLRMPDAERFFDFRWERVRQRLVVDEVDGCRFDVLEVHVSAVAKEDMAALKEALMRHEGATPAFQEERGRQAWVAVREFWFDLGMLDFPYEMPRGDED